ncbi:MAG: hypothetical protein AVDCRST_MAG07-737, partial [uncultured Frankineae bacterium]
MSGCLADVAAALVDGELDHAARERALRHLMRCPACRAEVDLQRRLKARLRDVGPPSPSAALTSRLLGLPVTTPLGPPEARSADPVDRPVRPPAAPRPATP